MARERGLTVDTAGFEKLMEEQRERARSGAEESRSSSLADRDRQSPTKFLGYDTITPAPTSQDVVDVERQDSVSCSNNSVSTRRWADRSATRAR